MPNILTRRHSASSKAKIPSDLSGLVLWLKADAGTFQDTARTTPASANADPVGGWADQSAAGNHLSQATAGSRPTLRLAVQNGLPTVHFVNQFLDTSAFTLNQPSTIMMAASNLGNYYTDGVSTVNTRVVNQPGTTTLRNYAGAVLDLTVANGVLASFQVVGGIFNGASSSVIFNGGLTTGNAGSAAAAGVRLGATGGATSSFMNGDMGEVVAYSRALSQSEISTLEAYLKRRWATP